MLQLDALAPLDPLPVLQQPYPDPTTTSTTVYYHHDEVTPLMVVGGIAFLGLLLGVSALYNNWAYGDWTCMVKNCVQSSTKRR